MLVAKDALEAGAPPSEKNAGAGVGAAIGPRNAARASAVANAVKGAPLTLSFVAACNTALVFCAATSVSSRNSSDHSCTETSVSDASAMACFRRNRRLSNARA